MVLFYFASAGNWGATLPAYSFMHMGLTVAYAAVSAQPFVLLVPGFLGLCLVVRNNYQAIIVKPRHWRREVTEVIKRFGLDKEHMAGMS